MLRIHESVFAPLEGSLRFVQPGAFNVDMWRLSYTRHLRELWRSNWEAFLTLVEDFGDVDYAPRRILRAALKQIAKSRRDEALRRARRGDQSRGHGTARAGAPPDPQRGPRTGAR